MPAELEWGRGWIRHVLLLILAFANAPVLAAPVSSPTVKLGHVAARLFWADKGEWSDDKLAKAPTWTGWNTVIGEGDAGGAADDLMIDVSLAAIGAEDATFAKYPLVVTAMAGKKMLGKRTVKDILLPYRGSTHIALFLTDVACAGRVDVIATYGKQTKRARLNMDCGE